MFDQYMCYCSNADETLGKSIADAEKKIPQLESALGEDAALKKQLEAVLKEKRQSLKQLQSARRKPRCTQRSRVMPRLIW